MTKAEGKKFKFEDISKINSEFLQTFEFKSKDKETALFNTVNGGATITSIISFLEN